MREFKVGDRVRFRNNEGLHSGTVTKLSATGHTTFAAVATQDGATWSVDDGVLYHADDERAVTVPVFEARKLLEVSADLRDAFLNNNPYKMGDAVCRMGRALSSLNARLNDLP